MGEAMIYEEVPTGVRGWNWGAFMFNFMWGFGNKSYLPLLCLIPFFNIFWIFVCGFKGNEWAWKNGHYQDVAQFKVVQATWNRAGLIYFIIFICLHILVIMLIIFTGIAGSLSVNSSLGNL